MTDYAAIFRAGRIPPAVVAWSIQVLRDLAAGAGDLLAVRHPLGFLCFPVERHDTCGICVHAWSPELVPAPLTTSEVHAHSWDLLSLVLFGELRNVRHSILADPPTHRVFEVHSRDGGDELRATSRLVGYQPDGCEVHRRGDTYSLPAGCFHATVAALATTIAVGMARPGMTDLSLGAVGGSSHHVRRERCDRVATARAARVVAGQLAE